MDKTEERELKIKELIKDLQTRLSLTYEGFRNEFYVFSRYYPRSSKVCHQYFFVDDCHTCGKTRMNRKHTPSKNCIRCSNILTAQPKNGGKRRRATKKTMQEKSMMDTLYSMAEENQRLKRIRDSSDRVTQIRL